jgi:hypothetical protein
MKRRGFLARLGGLLGAMVALSLPVTWAAAPVPKYVTRYRWSNDPKSRPGIEQIDIARESSTCGCVSESSRYLAGPLMPGPELDKEVMDLRERFESLVRSKPCCPNGLRLQVWDNPL